MTTYFLSYFFKAHISAGQDYFIKKMRTIKTKKQNYLKPTVSV